MTSDLKVSVIIPVYCVSAYVERCVRSVMNQTYENIECIIVDDATPDDSISKWEQMISAYQGPISFSVLHHQKNRGLSAARNTGIDAAHGDYLFFLDCDDELTEGSIEKLVKPIQKDASIEMVLGNVEFFSDGYPLPSSLLKRKKQPEQNIRTNEAIRKLFFKKEGCFSEAWNRLVKRDFLSYNCLKFEEGVIMESTLWNFLVVKYLCNLYIIPDVTYLYYRRPDSITTGTSRKEKDRNIGIVFEKIANNLTEGDKGREANFFFRGICILIIRNPQSQSIRNAAVFKNALASDHYRWEARLLSLLLFMSKSLLGRCLFSMVVKVVNIVSR